MFWWWIDHRMDVRDMKDFKDDQFDTVLDKGESLAPQKHDNV